MKFINLEYHPCDSRIRIVDHEICQTLNQRMGTGGGNVPLILIVLEDQGGGVMHWNYKELSPTLRAQMDGHPPVVVIKDDNTDREKIF